MALSPPSFTPLVPAAVYPHLSLLLVGSGLLFMAWFFTMQVSNGKQATDAGRFVKEITVAAIASSLLGFGLLFLCLNVGIYV